MRHCPSCGRELICDGLSGDWSCPQCGMVPPPLPPARRVNWFVVLGVLLAPALISLLGAKIDSDGLAVGGTFVGALVSGITNGVLLGLGLGKTTGLRVLLGIVFTVVFGILSLTLACFGCALGGFNLNVH